MNRPQQDKTKSDQEKEKPIFPAQECKRQSQKQKKNRNFKMYKDMMSNNNP